MKVRHRKAKAGPPPAPTDEGRSGTGRRWKGGLVAGLAGLSLAATAWFVASRRPDPPGPVIIYLVDTLRQDRVSIYGAPRPTTPAADELAAEGIVFENAYALSSWTRPSVATLFTSLLPSETATLNRKGVLKGDVATLPALLKTRGLKTAAFVANGNIFDRRIGFHRGFDLFVPVLGPGPERARAGAPEVVAGAVRFVEEQASPRFFLFVHVLDPHTPYVLAPPYATLFAEGAPPASERDRLLLDYDRCVKRADDGFRALAGALKRKGYWGSATVIYTSDHGEEFLEHGGLYHGTSLYEEQVRIPLIVKLPHGAGGGTHRREPVSLADVMPTLAAFAGLLPSPDWIGRSLLSTGDRPLYFTEDMDEHRLYAIREGDRKLVVRLYPSFERRLFDLGRDRGEGAGEDFGCDVTAPAGASALLGLLSDWRRRDAVGYPALRLEERVNEPLRIAWDVSFLLARKPFLTAEDYCEYAPFVKGGVLELRTTVPETEDFRLALSADDRGKAPAYRLAVAQAATGRPIDPKAPGAAVRLTTTAIPLLVGPPTDDVLKNLRNLGYLGGS